MLPYGRHTIYSEDVDEVVRVLQGDWLTTGPKVAEFEDAIGRVAGGLPAVTTTSGTAALHTAYAALGVSTGDEVIVPAMTFVATASSASMLGAKVKFADIDVSTGLIDPNFVETVVADRTKVITAVDYAGQPADYPSLQILADRFDAFLLADAAHSIGSSLGGIPVGNLADATTFSFFPTKNLTTGEGGAAVFRDHRVARDAREYHTIGLVRDPDRFRITDQGPWHQEVHHFGENYRLSDLACALGLSQLARLSEFKSARQRIVDRYNAELLGVEGLECPTRLSQADPVWHLYSVQILDGRRREVYERMREAGIGVQVNYIPVYWHPVYEDLGYRRGLCPAAELYYERQLSLPCFPAMSDSDIDQVISALVKILS